MKKLLALFIALLPTIGWGHEYEVAGLKIDHPIARATAKTARTTAGYFMIENTGSEADTLLSIEANFPRVELHTTLVIDGVASMQRVMGVEIPPGGTIMFEQGGMHVMFMGVSEQLVEGETVPAVMVFENAGRLEIEFKIEKIESIGHMNH